MGERTGKKVIKAFELYNEDDVMVQLLYLKS